MYLSARKLEVLGYSFDTDVVGGEVMGVIIEPQGPSIDVFNEICALMTRPFPDVAPHEVECAVEKALNYLHARIIVGAID